MGGDYYSYSQTTPQHQIFANGYVGTDFTFFFSQGDVQPYIGAGVMVFLYPYSNSLSWSAAPNVRAGLNLKINSGLSAFGEVRHIVGMNNLVVRNDQFMNATMLAFGVSFFPRFN
jgi:hypothetical protein